MRFLLFILSLSIAINIQSQEPIWTQLEADPPYGGDGWKVGVDLSNNIYVLSGWSYPGWWDHGSTIIKYSPGGEKLWACSNQVDTASIFGYALNDHGYSFIIWNEVNFFFYGEIIAVDSSGNKIYEHSLNDYVFNSVDCDNDGNAYVVGIKKYSFNNWDIVLIKYNVQGEMEWEITWDYPGENTVGRTVLVNETGIYAAGNSWYANFILKYDTNGNLLDVAYFFQNGYDYIFRWLNSEEDSFGNIYLYGLNEAQEGAIKHSFIYKFDPSLNKLWHDTTTLFHQGLYGMSIDENHNVLLCGRELELNCPVYLKYKSDGDKAWHLTLEEGHGHFRNSATKSDRIYYTGYIYYPDSVSSQMILYTIDQQGNFINQFHYPAAGIGSGEGSDLIVDNDGNLITIGTFEDTTTEYCLTIKYDLLTSTKDYIICQTEEIIVYPNPADDIVHFKFTKADPNLQSSIVIRNLQGQKVKEENISQVSQYTLFVADLKAGVYFYVIRNVDEVLQQGKILIK